MVDSYSAANRIIISIIVAAVIAGAIIAMLYVSLLLLLVLDCITRIMHATVTAKIMIKIVAVIVDHQGVVVASCFCLSASQNCHFL